jgi:dTDP-4-dehydrorhamnose 3,5-epimerase-like enzyme
MHYQIDPFSEAKVATCLSGSICDVVVVDLRPDSATYRHWLAVEISAAACDLCSLQRLKSNPCAKFRRV